jgi:triosephosphate isomerase
MYAANWKMNMSAGDAADFADKAKAWIARHHELQNYIVICPSFPFILPLAIELGNSGIITGAQNCSEFPHGAYTGQVSAKQLADVGAMFCIVGHNECRSLLHESSDAIGKKVSLLFEHAINPIVCVGETAFEFEQHQTLTILEQQLAPIIKAIKSAQSIPHEFIIAYEPVWAIGTGKTPEPQTLENVFSWILSHMQSKAPSIQKIRILYGGSVDSLNAKSFKHIKGLGGFLIGGASLDFQKFKNIVGLD